MPPYNLQTNINTFMTEFNSTLLQYHSNSRNAYLCGDYNIDLLKMTSIQMHEDYFDNILSAGYIPTIILPTRLSENSTLIDNIFANNVSNQITPVYWTPILVITNPLSYSAMLKYQIIKQSISQ